jgi:WD repeat-containing protein 23
LTGIDGGALHTTRNVVGEDEETEYDTDWDDHASQVAHQWFPEVTEPQKAGVELLSSGDFGRVGDKLRSRRNDLNIAKFIHKRSSQPIVIPCKEDYASVCRSE